ncbi:uncharacterized protein A4U43_C05F21110 [Asparagus officinalis]|uniref:Uncharacterized protein n=1 Tax=Asparagus officinalis TaxID=4686 RepID=A0A5P1EXN8_ASPOF|nr:uncharacterized protein A4U43_C05F21110 [Asparagus officinalis]
MGANLCTLRQSCFAKLPDEDSDGDVPAWGSTVELLERNKKMGIEKDEKTPALEQWMFSSPSVPEGGVDGSRVQQLCWHSAKVSPVSYSTPRRSQSGKRVSFRLPEDADIHVYDCDDEKDVELMS